MKARLVPTVIAAVAVGVFLSALVRNFLGELDCEFRYLQADKPKCATDLLQPAIGLAVAAVAFVLVFRWSRKPFAAGSWEIKEAFDGALVSSSLASVGAVMIVGYFATGSGGGEAISAFIGAFLVLLAIPASVYSLRRLRESEGEAG